MKPLLTSIVKGPADRRILVDYAFRDPNALKLAAQRSLNVTRNHVSAQLDRTIQEKPHELISSEENLSQAELGLAIATVKETLYLCDDELKPLFGRLVVYTKSAKMGPWTTVTPNTALITASAMSLDRERFEIRMCVYVRKCKIS